MQHLRNIVIIGAGTMGHSIALDCAWKGFTVTMHGQDAADLDRGSAGIKSKLAVLVREGLVPRAEEELILDRIACTTSLEEAVVQASFIIEAAPEILTLKQELFAKLEGLCAPETIFASNTSGLKPGLIAEALQHPERFLVMHFWNPAHLIPLVEVVPAAATSTETIEASFRLLQELGKKAVLVKKEIPGFISNRLQFALFREAQFLLEQGVASQEDIDAAVTYSIGRRLPVTGPFLSADLGGLDVFDNISAYLFPDLSNAAESSPTMKKLVSGGEFGAKSGQGFYNWQEENGVINEQREKMLIRFLKLDEDR
jgi:3-hydroxybutyryl-CoA dehydrogenase